MTTVNPPEQRLVLKGIADMLATATSLSVGVGGAPEPVPAEPDPYLILYPIPGGSLSGPPLSDSMHTDAVWLVQVTAVGYNHEQAVGVLDAARKAMLSRTDRHYTNAITIANTAVIAREHDSYGGAMAAGLLWSAVERFNITTTPA